MTLKQFCSPIASADAKRTFMPRHVPASSDMPGKVLPSGAQTPGHPESRRAPPNIHSVVSQGLGFHTSGWTPQLGEVPLRFLSYVYSRLHEGSLQSLVSASYH